MGCDIHLTVEQKTPTGWVCVDTVLSHHISPSRVTSKGLDFSSPAALDRNYKRFAALAGVRGDGPAPRGLPNDLSETTAFLVERWGDDGHSHSWLSVDEAGQIFLDTEFSEPSGWHKEYPQYYYFNVEDETKEYRVVFWFDN